MNIQLFHYIIGVGSFTVLFACEDFDV